MRFKKDENSNPWMAYTDLGVALVSLFILAFVAMATLKEQKAEDLTRTEEEVLSCQEEMRKIAAERKKTVKSRFRQVSFSRLTELTLLRKAKA